MNSPSNADLAVGKEIRRHRRLAGLTQKQIAARIGITGAQFHRYETGSTRVTATRLVEIAEILGVRPNALLAVAIQPAPFQEAPAGDLPHDIVDLLQVFMTINDPQHRGALMMLARMMSSPSQQQAERETVVDAKIAALAA